MHRRFIFDVLRPLIIVTFREAKKVSLFWEMSLFWELSLFWEVEDCSISIGLFVHNFRKIIFWFKKTFLIYRVYFLIENWKKNSILILKFRKEKMLRITKKQVRVSIDEKLWIRKKVRKLRKIKLSLIFQRNLEKTVSRPCVLDILQKSDHILAFSKAV